MLYWRIYSAYIHTFLFQYLFWTVLTPHLYVKFNYVYFTLHLVEFHLKASIFLLSTNRIHETYVLKFRQTRKESRISLYLFFILLCYHIPVHILLVCFQSRSFSFWKAVISCSSHNLNVTTVSDRIHFFLI